MNRSLFAILPLVAALAACGGGGDGPAPVAQAPAPVAAQPGVVTDVPLPSYTSGSEELTAFNLLNQERSSCGFGKLAQNTQLDSMARGHADWVTYHQIISHYQDTGTHLFTGVTPEDRATAAGYGGLDGFLVQDEFAYNYGTYGNDKAGFGTVAVRNLLNAPYHAIGLVNGHRDVGISLRNAYDSGASDAGVANQGRKALVINPARLASQASQLAGISENTVLTYPCQGTTGVNFALYGEMPNPVPGRDLLNNPLGSSVQVAIREGNTLTITSASMVNTSTQAAVTLRAPVTSANDPHGAYAANRGYIVADAPLSANTTYTVTINGTNNGAAFTQTFSFTTGSESAF